MDKDFEQFAIDFSRSLFDVIKNTFDKNGRGVHMQVYDKDDIPIFNATICDEAFDRMTVDREYAVSTAISLSKLAYSSIMAAAEEGRMEEVA